MKINPLKGMKDILPKEQRLRDYVQEKILETYCASGFERISTPILEDIENLDKSDGGDNLNLIFKLLKRGDKLQTTLNTTTIDEKNLSDMGLRYDLTLPLSRFFAANRNELQFPFKVIQSDRVFRAERPQKGRSREFIQCDIDILGDSSCNAEIELIDVTSRALMNIGFNDFCININDRRILHAMLESMGFPSEALNTTCVSFDKMDKIGIEGVQKELIEKNMPKEAVKALVDFVATSSNDELSLDDVASKCLNSSIAYDLKYIISKVKKVSKGKYKIRYTPSLVRGQGYYTGVVFEIISKTFSSAVGGGGRYDNMIGKFIGEEIPAVGFSIGFERICEILIKENYKIPQLRERCVLLYDDEIDFALVLEMADELRKDYLVTVLRKAKKMKSMFNMLEKQGYTKFAMFNDGKLIIK